MDIGIFLGGIGRFEKRIIIEKGLLSTVPALPSGI
jgi:hypothetical protein